MPKTLSELIADAAASDDLEFAGPDGMKVKLADLRGFRSSVETERQGAESARKNAEKTAKEAKDIFDALTAAQAEFKKQNEPPPSTKKSDWKKNPLYDELVPVLEAAEAAANEARETANNLKKSLDQSQAIYALERMRRQWAESKVKPSGKKFEEVVAEVIAAKEFDDLGLPTLDKYLYRTSEPDRIKVATDEAVAAAKKEWEKAQRASDIPRPGKFQTVKPSDAPIKKIEDLTSAVVSQDPEIAELWETRTH
jgi:hypothetical protein